MGKHVARVNMCGPPSRKGLGISDPAADDAAIKVSTLFRLLNTAPPSVVGGMTASGWDALQAHHQRSTTARIKATIPALHRGAARALKTCPRGERR